MILDILAAIWAHNKAGFSTGSDTSSMRSKSPPCSSSFSLEPNSLILASAPAICFDTVRIVSICPSVSLMVT